MDEYSVFKRPSMAAESLERSDICMSQRQLASSLPSMLNSLLDCDQDILVPAFDLTDTIQLELSIIANGGLLR